MPSPPPERHSLEEGRLHRILVGTNELQRLSSAVVISVMLADALVIAWVWMRFSLLAGIAAGAIFLAASAINWTLLRELPRRHRSFGPDKPTALALTAVLLLVTLLIGFIATSPNALLGVLAAAAALTAIAVYATWIEPFRVGVTRQTLTTEHLIATDAEQPCLRLLHVGDLHVERETERERTVNTLIEQLQPDVIVFSGDFVNLSYTWDEQAKRDIRRIIGAWHAPLGVYCVPGTPVVEPLPRVMEFVQGLENLTLLLNRAVTIQTPCGAVQLLGHVTTHDLPTDRQALDTAARDLPDEGLRVLLTHSPDIAPEAADAGFDLYLCGHTHGGQLRLPLIGALLSSSQLGKRFVMGRYAVGSMTLYTTRGLGMEGYGAPRARLLCPPEIVLWEIYGMGPSVT